VLLGADAFHNLADGAAIAAAFLVSPRLGLLTAVAVIAHEAPQELADYVFLREDGMSRRRALLAMAAVQLTAGIGAASTAAGAALWKGVSGLVLAVAAGTFLHIVEVDLVPLLLDERTERPGWNVLMAMACGLGLAVLGMVL
jgi:zinc and cadmium transporter